MKTVAMAALLMLLSVTHSSAQTGSTAAQQHAVKQARVKMWTGIGMVATGAILLPITSSTNDRQDETKSLTALGLMGAGSGVIYWGFRQQQKALRPSTALTVSFGRRNGVILARCW